MEVLLYIHLSLVVRLPLGVDVDCFIIVVVCLASGSYLQKGQLMKGTASIKDSKGLGRDHKSHVNKYRKTPPEDAVSAPGIPQGPSVHHLHYHTDLREKIVRLEYRVSHLTYQVFEVCKLFPE